MQNQKNDFPDLSKLTDYELVELCNDTTSSKYVKLCARFYLSRRLAFHLDTFHPSTAG